jgi:hypothetical protein
VESSGSESKMETTYTSGKMGNANILCSWNDKELSSFQDS